MKYRIFKQNMFPLQTMTQECSEASAAFSTSAIDIRVYFHKSTTIHIRRCKSHRHHLSTATRPQNPESRVFVNSSPSFYSSTRIVTLWASSLTCDDCFVFITLSVSNTEYGYYCAIFPHNLTSNLLVGNSALIYLSKQYYNWIRLRWRHHKGPRADQT